MKSYIIIPILQMEKLKPGSDPWAAHLPLHSHPLLTTLHSQPPFPPSLSTEPGV